MEKISISVNSGNLLLSPPNETRASTELHPYSDSTSFSNNFPSLSFAILASFILSSVLRHCLFSFKISSIHSTNATRLYYALKNTVPTVYLKKPIVFFHLSLLFVSNCNLNDRSLTKHSTRATGFKTTMCGICTYCFPNLKFKLPVAFST